MDIDKQVRLLNDINIMPFKLRFLRNFIRFLNSNSSWLVFLVLKRICHLVSYSNTKHSKYSFPTISIKILNLFLFNYTESPR